MSIVDINPYLSHQHEFELTKVSNVIELGKDGDIKRLCKIGCSCGLEQEIWIPKADRIEKIDCIAEWYDMEN